MLTGFTSVVLTGFTGFTTSTCDVLTGFTSVMFTGFTVLTGFTSVTVRTLPTPVSLVCRQRQT